MTALGTSPSISGRQGSQLFMALAHVGHTANILINAYEQIQLYMT